RGNIRRRRFLIHRDADPHACDRLRAALDAPLALEAGQRFLGDDHHVDLGALLEALHQTAHRLIVDFDHTVLEGCGQRIDQRFRRAAREHAQLLAEHAGRGCGQKKQNPFHARFPLRRTRSRSCANCSGGTGSPYRKPCTWSQPWRFKKCSWASVSTPSASTFRCSAGPSEMIAWASVPSSASDPLRMSRTKERSIFSASIGRSFRYERLE